MDGSQPELRLPEALSIIYSPSVSDRRFLFLILVLSALSLLLLGAVLFSP
jgi:hypothetical protein